MWFISLLVLIFILGIIILVHEFGHFIWAKIFKVHIYEFSIGMGPIIFTHKGKDKVDYNIRAIPIGGFVSMAGEVYEDDEKIDKKTFMCNKPWYQRVIILIAGVCNNFLLAILILFISSLIWGGTINIPEIEDVVPDLPMANAGITAGDKILEINGRKVSNWDSAQILLIMKSKDNTYDLKIEHSDGEIENIDVTPITEKDEETGIETQVFGIYIKQETMTGLWGSIKYSFIKFGSIVNSMALTIEGLFTGKISIQALSGPVGMYEVVDESISYGISYMLYIIAFLSINVGFINILPFPAFDGGHVFFLIIEKIKGSPVNSKFENTCHLIGFALLFLLMIYITIQDVIRFF